MKSWIPEEMRGKTRSYITVVVIGILLTACFVYFGQIWGAISRVVEVAMPFFLGFAIAFLLLPIVNYMEKFFNRTLFRKKAHPRLNRGISSGIAFLLLLALIAAFFAIMLPQLIRSVKSIMQYIATFVSMNSDRINEMLLKFEFLSIEGEQLVVAWEKVVSELANYTSLLVNNAMAIAGGISSGIYTVVLHFLVGLIAAFYLLLDKETFCAQVKKLCYSVFKPATCETLIYWTRRANRIFAGFITGKIVDSIIIGVICYICMMLFGIEYPLLISVIIGLTNVIPFFGPFIGAIPCGLILLLVNPMSALWFAIFILILQQVDGNVIGPFILGDYVGVSAFWIMIAIVVGGGLFGFVGMLLGVPVFALIYAIAKTISETRLRAQGLPIERAAYADAPESLHGKEKARGGKR